MARFGAAHRVAALFSQMKVRMRELLLPADAFGGTAQLGKGVFAGPSPSKDAREKDSQLLRHQLRLHREIERRRTIAPLHPHRKPVTFFGWSPQTREAFSMDSAGGVCAWHYAAAIPDKGNFPVTLEPKARPHPSAVVLGPNGTASAESSGAEPARGGALSWQLPPAAFMTTRQMTLLGGIGNHPPVFLLGGHWDGTARVHWAADGAPLQAVLFHRRIVICVAADTHPDSNESFAGVFCSALRMQVAPTFLVVSEHWPPAV